MRSILPAYLAYLILAGCVTTPDGGHQLSETGKVALQEVASIAVRRSLSTSPRAAEKAQNIREIAVRLQSITEVTSVSDLRAAVEKEVNALGLNPVDRADAQSLLNIFHALLLDYVGRNELDADALVRVNEFITMVVNALPPQETPA